MTTLIEHLALAFLLLLGGAASTPPASAGRYVNPIIDADYSDPDVIRVGDDYWMVASSFNCFPGIPVLHSRDMVNWEIANHVYSRLPLQKYDRPAHGEGSWAPSIRYHEGLFYVYFCTPEDGLFVARASDPRGVWDLTQMADVVKWEDPCPLWDDDGSAYLAHSIHRGGPVVVHRMSPDGLTLLDDGVTVYHDEALNPILEGIKLEKRDGWYYVLAPAGGVEQGWQTALRSRSIYGPYEARRILEQGPTDVNGPHQGALVEDQNGRWWFFHFQSKGILGRVVHLQPAAWTADGWPVAGEDHDGDGTGCPVASGDTGLPPHPLGLAASDGFDAPQLGLQWQWQANPDPRWWSLSDSPGRLRLNAVNCPSEHGNLWYAPNLLLQKLTGGSFTATVLVEPRFEEPGDAAGLLVMGREYSYIAAVREPDGSCTIAVTEGRYDKFATRPRLLASIPLQAKDVMLRVSIEGDSCSYSFSIDGGAEFHTLGPACKVEGGMWIGAKVGLFCMSPSLLPSSGYALFDSFSVQK